MLDICCAQVGKKDTLSKCTLNGHCVTCDNIECQVHTTAVGMACWNADQDHSARCRSDHRQVYARSHLLGASLMDIIRCLHFLMSPGIFLDVVACLLTTTLPLAFYPD